MITILLLSCFAEKLTTTTKSRTPLPSIVEPTREVKLPITSQPVEEISMYEKLKSRIEDLESKDTLSLEEFSDIMDSIALAQKEDRRITALFDEADNLKYKVKDIYADQVVSNLKEAVDNLRDQSYISLEDFRSVTTRISLAQKRAQDENNIERANAIQDLARELQSFADRIGE